MEKVLVLGSSGFVGRNVSNYLIDQGRFEVHGTSRNKETTNVNEHFIDLDDIQSIDAIMSLISPEFVISCVGVIDPNGDVDANVRYTKNLLESIARSNDNLKRIIISGSAAEYGVVEVANKPVKESTPLHAELSYGLSKVNEEKIALELAAKYNLPVVVVRIFNPIGAHMPSKFLVPRLVEQIKLNSQHPHGTIELSRLDSKRDYVSVRDVGGAFGAILEGNPKHEVYNIGSGRATSNQELAQLVLNTMDLMYQPSLQETSDIVEPAVASWADIRRMQDDFNWTPKVSLEEAVRGIIHAENKSN